jgi:ATPase subunit of ABC transporter with duplicated ATPase domains
MYLSLSNIKKSYSFNDVLTNCSFSVYKGDRVGIVGSNGCGKTTIFKLIYGTENPNEGEIFIRKGITIGYLDQIPEYDLSVIEVIKLGLTHIYDMQADLEALEKNLDDERILKRYGVMQEHFIQLGGYNVESKIKTICSGLGIDEDFLDQEFSLLSGGEKSRVILAQILCKGPDVLLLDEPSNHLDFKTIMWLEKYLEKYDGTVIVISHDRYFLDRVATKIINVERGQAYEYKGNYSYYVEQKEIKNASQEKMYANQQKKITQLETAAKRLRQWGKQSDNEAMFIRAKAIERRIERMDKVEKVYTPDEMKFNLQSPLKMGRGIVRSTGFSKSFDNRLLIDNAEIEILSPEKCCIIGENGAGKTTLFKMMMGLDEDYSGDLVVNKSVKFGYLSQEIVYPNRKQTIIANFKDSVPCNDGQARNLLAKYLFKGDDVFKLVGDLSGGEKSRLELAKLVNGDFNVLLLDEPTNHLDISARETLEENLLNYKGSIISISHDRYFIDKISDYIIELDKQKLKKYFGDFEFYSEEKQKEYEKEVVQVKKVVKKEPVKKAGLSKFKLEQLEQEIHQQEDQLAILKQKTFDEEYYLNADKAKALSLEIKALTETLEKNYEILFENSHE